MRSHVVVSRASLALLLAACAQGSAHDQADTAAPVDALADSASPADGGDGLDALDARGAPADASAPGADAFAADTGAADAALPPPGSTTTVTLTETPEAFPNPMMGFRPSVYIGGAFQPHEYTSTYKQYIAYSDLESSSADTVQKIVDWSNASWADLPAKNLKVIPRVVIVYPGTGEYWGDIPHDGTPNEWVTSALEGRLAAFVAKLGQAWDHDPRVAAVEMGLWGKWGEHNIYPDDVEGGNRIPLDVQQVLAPAFTAAFPDKQVLVRYPDTFTGSTNFGFYWDSFALPDDDNAGGGLGIVARDLWPGQMQSGEVAYDWGDQSNLGGSPDGTLSSNSDTQYVIGFIQKVHTSSLGWIAEYTSDNGVISANAALVQKAFGYRYVVTQATFSDAIAPSGGLGIAFTVKNVASAPFYYAWPVGVGLLDGNGAVVWSGALQGVDIRQWMPGQSYAVKGSVAPGVPDGVYTLALSILDPSGNTPSLRFANTSYLPGGWTALGKVGVGQTPPDQGLPPFASLYSDHTLHYTMGGASADAGGPGPGSGNPGTNLALGRPVTVSSTESENGGVHVGPDGVDGDLTTRWASEWGLDPSWIDVDLGGDHAVRRVKVTWEWSYAAEYQIQVSEDAVTWTTAYTGQSSFSGDDGVTDVTFAPAVGRYVRLLGTKRATTYGYSLYELEVYE